MKPLTLTPSVQFRGYPRLTAPDSGKTRLNAPNRAKIFSGGSRASIRACATPTATPVHPSALARTNTAATKMAGPPHGFSALFCAVWCYLVLFGPNFYLALGSVLASGCPYMDIIRYLNTPSRSALFCPIQRCSAIFSAKFFISARSGSCVLSLV